MIPYFHYLHGIMKRGITIPPARENMPSVKCLPHASIPLRFDKGLPILTGKTMPFYSILGELICFMQGKTNVIDFHRMGCDVWWQNAYKYNVEDKGLSDYTLKQYIDHGKKIAKDPNYGTTSKLSIVGYDLGNIYSSYWRDNMDQLRSLINRIIKEPYSRYAVMDSWDAAKNKQTSQPNCHVYFQATVLDRIPSITDSRRQLYDQETLNKLDEDEEDIPSKLLYTHLTQRSCDAFLGVPFNLTSYSLLTVILSIITKTIPVEFHWVGVNNHVYSNTMDAAQQYIDTIFDKGTLNFPKLSIDIPRMNTLEKIEMIKNIDDLKSIFKLVDYESHGKIAAPLSVGLR